MIYIVHPRCLEMLPPLISLIRVLKNSGESVCYLGLIESGEAKTILGEIGAEYALYPYRLVTLREAPFVRFVQKCTEWIRPYLKRRWLWKILRRLGFDQSKDIIWSVEMEGAAILGDRALVLGHRHVHTFYELGDEACKNLRGFDYRRFVDSATIVQCEYNRACIFQAENGIGRRPFVLPNKPYAHPRTRNLPVGDPVAKKILEGWKGKRVFLYQGGLQNDRGAIVAIIESVCMQCPEAIVAVMGKRTAEVDRLLSSHGNFSYVPFVRPPHHLEVTSHADIGLAFYQGGRVFGLSPLNPVYCAPNKIYEYAGYGMPVLCNDVPGLRYTIGMYNAGICLSSFDTETVGAAAERLLTDYARYSNNATVFYDATNLNEIVRMILSSARH